MDVAVVLILELFTGGGSFRSPAANKSIFSDRCEGVVVDDDFFSGVENNLNDIIKEARVTYRLIQIVSRLL